MMTPTSDLERLRAHLRAALAPERPRPGAAAQARLAPEPRPGWDPHADPPPGRPAAVLVLVYPLGADRRPALLYTVRTDSVAAHRGQVSFPGGCLERGESPEAAALREAYEETGVAPDLPEVIGRLTPLWIPATGFTVTPVVALACTRPDVARNPVEVERILEVPVAELLRPGAVQEEVRAAGAAWTRIRYFDLGGGARLWGATAMMTAEWLAVLGW